MALVKNDTKIFFCLEGELKERAENLAEAINVSVSFLVKSLLTEVMTSKTAESNIRDVIASKRYKTKFLHRNKEKTSTSMRASTDFKREANDVALSLNVSLNTLIRLLLMYVTDRGERGYKAYKRAK